MHATFRAFGKWRGFDPSALEIVDFEIGDDAKIFLSMKDKHLHLTTESQIVLLQNILPLPGASIIAILTFPAWTLEH